MQQIQGYNVEIMVMTLSADANEKVPVSQLYITDCEAAIVFIDCLYLKEDFEMTMEMI